MLCMNMKYWLIVFCVIGIVLVSKGQSTRDVTTPKAPKPTYQAYKKEKKRRRTQGRKDDEGNEKE